jgi:hypothetical protein
MENDWNDWNDPERADAVLALLDFGLSRRAIARIAGCSEGLIRRIEIVGRLPYQWKQLLLQGYSTRRVVDEWRVQQREGSE